MSRNTAQIVAAGLWVFGVTGVGLLALRMLIGENKDSAEFIMLTIGVSCLLAANWITAFVLRKRNAKP